MTDEQTKEPVQCEQPKQPEPIEPIMKFFAYEHLQGNLRVVSATFHALAVDVILKLPRSAERTVALRKLLESKDAAVRAALP